MFSDETLETVEFKSTWKKERSIKDDGCQTSELAVKERGVQSVKKKDGEAQTEDEILEDIKLYEDESPELLAFLRKMEPLVAKELQKNRRSHAFDGYAVSWAEETGEVTCTHSLTHADMPEQLPVSCLSWNSSGSVIAVSYGRFDHEDWCTHKSILCTWNLDRRNVDVNKADVTIDQSSCLMCIAYHPQQPSWLAGGTFNGEVLVWDLGRDDEMLIASSGIGDDSHREPVSKLLWVTSSDSQGQKYQLVSVGNDGRILVWQLDQHKRVLKLVDGFVLLTESLPRQLRTKAGVGQQMGISCISFSPDDETSFLVGSDSGGVFKCSTNTRGTAASSDIPCSVNLRSPVNFSFSPHSGPVHSVECSPYHRNLFLSSSSDTSLRIYSMLQTQPVLILEPNAGYLYGACWSPVRQSVIAVATGTGHLFLYDLKQKRSSPVLQLEASTKGAPIYSLQFNKKKTELLATGDGVGCVMIWRLSDELTQQTPNDQELLDEIAGSALEH